MCGEERNFERNCGSTYMKSTQEALVNRPDSIDRGRLSTRQCVASLACHGASIMCASRSGCVDSAGAASSVLVSWMVSLMEAERAHRKMGKARTSKLDNPILLAEVHAVSTCCCHSSLFWSEIGTGNRLGVVHELLAGRAVCITLGCWRYWSRC